MSANSYDGSCEIIWPANNALRTGYPGHLVWDGVKIFDTQTGEGFLGVLKFEISVGGVSGFTPGRPITVKLLSMADADGSILKGHSPVTYENGLPRIREYLYLVTKMYVDEA